MAIVTLPKITGLSTRAGVWEGLSYAALRADGGAEGLVAVWTGRS